VSYEELCKRSTVLVGRVCWLWQTSHSIVGVIAAILQEKYRQKGFFVLAFPINDFRQELPSNEEIETWVHDNFPQAKFPMFSLSSLEENPVFAMIRKQVPSKLPKWNFFKYLVDGNGHVVKVYDHHTNPLAMVNDIEALLETYRGGGKLVTE
jgi:glutathione peroxidase-family protein